MAMRRQTRSRSCRDRDCSQPCDIMIRIPFADAPVAAGLLFSCCWTSAAHAESPIARLAVNHDPEAKTVAVTVEGAPFTTLHYNIYTKPILWPVHGPGGQPLTRDWPMKPDTPGEDKDHPHHKSLWYTHGAVNGIDFWSESDKAGKIITKTVTRAEVTPDGQAVIEFNNEWRGPDGRVVCTDTTTIHCGIVGAARFIDYSITLAATHGDVVFGDTKEGTMAVRTRPELNVDRKNPLAKGASRNREGVTGKEIWGLKSAWVDYSAPLGDSVVGLALFDHPSNLRHPTTWHARDYGLAAANPFGLHDFSKDNAKGAGDHTIPAGQSHPWRYGVYLYQGTLTAEEVDAAWKAWAER